MKIFSLCFILLLMACESKRLIFRSDIVLKGNVQLDLRKEFERYGALVEGKKLHSSLDKGCIGILVSNSVFVCNKDSKVTVLSFYKITEKNKSMKLEMFMAEGKKGEEERSYKLHLEIVEKLRLESSQTENSLAQREEIISILNGFSE